MKTLRATWLRLMGVFRKERFEQHLNDEIESHLQLHTDDNVQAGMTSHEARRQAVIKLGGVEQAKEEYRDRHTLPLLESVLQDARHGVRMLRKSPGFTLTAVLTLALGIGANTAIFSAVSAVLFRPLPVREPEHLFSIRNTGLTNAMFSSFSYPNYKDIRDTTTAFSDVMAYRLMPVGMSHEGQNQRVWCFMVSGNYFSGLGLRPHLGRLLTPEDDQTPGSHPVVVVSYDSWQKRFARRADIVNTEIIVNRRSYTIVGVAPQGFTGTEVVAAPELWFPVAMQTDLEPGANLMVSRNIAAFFMLGRVQPGVSDAQLRADLASLSRALASDYPEENKGMRIDVSDAGILSAGFFRGPAVGFAMLLMGVAGVVLLLACANLSNMLLARATERHEETAIRLAMGANRGRLIRQLLTESMLLAMIGGIVGILPSLWPLRFEFKMKPPADFPILLNISWDYRVLLFAFAASVFTGLAFGLLPALQASKAEVASALKREGVAGRGRRWVGNALIAAQVALSVVLLTGAGLMLRALDQAGTVNLGFNPADTVEAGFDLRMQGYDAARGREFQKRLLERVSTLAGVEAAGLTDVVPVDLHFPNIPVFIEGAAPERDADTPRILSSRASPGYLRAMGTRLLAGRDFAANDDTGKPLVAIVNLALARRFFGSPDHAIGKRFSLGNPQASKLEIIGVIEDGKYNRLSSEPQPFALRALWQTYSGSTGLVARGNVQTLMPLLRRELREMDALMPVSVSPVADRLALALLPTRLATSVLGAFAALGLALAAIGIYGVISYSVSRRSRELGIRMALGARKADVLRLVIAQGMKPAVIGALIGLPASFALSRMMRGFLFGVSPADPITYAVAATLLGAFAWLACYLPALRATRVDPVVALRQE